MDLSWQNKQQEWMQRGIGATKQVIKHLDTAFEDFKVRVKIFISQANNEGNENYRMLCNKVNSLISQELLIII